MTVMTRNRKEIFIDSFNLQPGRILAKKYEVIGKLGEGWESEVYLVRELITGIERAAKFFFPQRNPNNSALRFYANKLYKLRHCPILIQYLTQETIIFQRIPITFLVSDYVEGEIMSAYLNRQPGKRISAIHGLLLLHALSSGIENIHHMGEYHGDLHMDNIIIQQYGLGYNLKLLDMFHWGAPVRANIYDDVCDLIRIFYDAIGGQKHYYKQSSEIKAICCGLKRSLILKKFRSAGQLREYLETMQWQ